MADFKLPIPGLKFDTSELELATRQLSAENGKDLATAFNKKMGWLLRRWLWETKKADYAKMARSLGMRLRMGKSGQKVTKTGKILKFKGGWKANRVSSLGGSAGSFRSKRLADEGAMVPIIIAMISKRKSGSPYKGVSRSAGKSAMRAAIKKKFGARARSIGYLKSAIATAQKPFLPFSSGGRGLPPMDRTVKQYGRPKGFGTLARAGNRMLAVAVDKSTTKRQGDKALRKYAEPALAKAYADELRDTREYLDKVLYETARKLGISAKR